MKNLIKSLSVSVMMVAAMFTAVPASYAGDDAIDKAIKGRKAYMQLYSYYAGPLFGMAKGKVEYDAELASTLAANLSAVNNLKNGSMWPADSHNKARKGKTRALASIWESGSDIGDKGQAMRDAVEALTFVAGDGLDALRGAIGDLGQSCKGCHDDFRAEDF